MRSIKNLLKQKCFEEGIRRTVEHVLEIEEGHINGLIRPAFGSCSEEKASIILEYPVMEWESNPNNVMHGGIIATIMDTTLGILANYLCIGIGKTFAPTINMSINYLKPVPVGETLCVEAKVTSFGKSLITVYGEAYIKGTTGFTANATATYIMMSVGQRVGQVSCPV
jgi:uncharacterized protein (TIGR00369 family)